MRSRDKLKNYISTTTISKAPNMAVQLYKMRSLLPYNYVTFWSRGLAKSREKLNTLYLQYRKSYDYQTRQGLTYYEGLPLIKSHNSLNAVHVRSRDKFKTLYHHYHNAYSQETWKGNDLPWGTPTDKVAWQFNHVVLWDHGTNSKRLS